MPLALSFEPLGFGIGSRCAHANPAIASLVPFTHFLFESTTRAPVGAALAPCPFTCGCLTQPGLGRVVLAALEKCVEASPIDSYEVAVDEDEQKLTLT